MSDLIDREELKKAAKRIESLPWGDEEGNRVEFQWTSKELESLIEKAPSAEPKIIRCKDCKYWTNNIGNPKLRDNYCNEEMHGFYYRCSGNDYCSFAERRTNE